MIANIYRKQLKAVSRFSSQKDVRYYLNGVLLQSSTLQSRLVATDGHAVAVCRADAKDENQGAFDIIIPNEAVKAILAIKANKYQIDEPIVITQSGKEYRADYAGQSILFTAIDGKFPDYQRVIPTSCDGTAAHIDPDLLVRCKRAAEDLGISSKGYYDFVQGGQHGCSVCTIGSDFVAAIMPMRQDPISASDASWARDALPVHGFAIAA